MSTNKGQMSFAGAEAFITMFLVAIIMVVVAATIIGNTQNNSLPTEVINVTNAQFTNVAANASNSLGTGRIINIAVWNATNQSNTLGSPNVAGGNYTLDFAGGVFNLLTPGYVGANLNYSYNYTRNTQGGAFNSTANAAMGLAGTTSLFPVLGLVAVASLVIGLVVAGFALAGRRL